jgi:hypothetical protein
LIVNVNKHLILLLAGLLTLLLTAGCQNETPEPKQTAAQPATAAAPAPTAAPAQAAGWTGSVTETMDAGGYTYVEVDTGSEKIWAAGPKFTVNVGDAVVVPQGMAMQNYHSKTLNRDFPVVYFVDAIMVGGAEAALTEDAKMPENHPKVDTAAASTVDLTGIAVAEGGQTVEQVFTQTDALVGKPVTLRGKVVKYNADIMGKNWLHVQDGTGADGTNDITVTTAATANVGDTVLITGVLVTDKDFGYGYKYAVIVEDATVVVE